MPGFKYNMTDVQASFGFHQLKRLETNLTRREEIWQMYNESLRDLPVDLPADAAPECRHAMHLYTIRVRPDCGLNRDELMDALYKMNIGSGVHYTALHLHPYYHDTYNYRPGDFPNAELVGNSTLSLPFSAGLTDADVKDVISALKKILG